MDAVKVRKVEYFPLADYLEEQGFIVEQVEGGLLKIHRLGGDEIFIVLEDDTLYFQQDLGLLKEFEGEKYYGELLDLNSEITPVSVAIDSSGAQPKLILVERRLQSDLDSEELLALLDAMEIAADRVGAIFLQKVGEK